MYTGNEEVEVGMVFVQKSTKTIWVIVAASDANIFILSDGKVLSSALHPKRRIGDFRDWGYIEMWNRYGVVLLK